MAQGFVRFYRRFWADERVRQLTPEGKAVAVYLLTGQSNRVGLFHFSVGLASEQTGIPAKRFRYLMDRVCHTLSWRYDEGASVLWIRSWWRWNPPNNTKALIGFLKDLADVPNTNLLADFREHRDTLSDTLYHTLCDRVSMPKPYPEPQPETPLPPDGGELDLASRGNAKPHGRDTEPEGFAEFYQAYPRHEDRRDAARAFKAALKRHPDIEAKDLVNAAGWFRERCQRDGKLGTEYVKYPATWLNKDSFLTEFADEAAQG